MSWLQMYQKGQKIHKTPEEFTSLKHGQKCGTEQCAQWQNDLLRKTGYSISGNAWDLKNIKPIYSGYDNTKRPKEFDPISVNNYLKNAADRFFKDFKSQDLDTTKVYIGNMFYKGSPHQETAFNEGKKGIAGTHTGTIYWKNTTPKSKGKWIISHNIHGKLIVQPFTEAQGSSGKWGVTAISEPRKETSLDALRKNTLNSLRTLFEKKKHGGKINYIEKYGKYKYIN